MSFAEPEIPFWRVTSQVDDKIIDKWYSDALYTYRYDAVNSEIVDFKYAIFKHKFQPLHIRTKLSKYYFFTQIDECEQGCLDIFLPDVLKIEYLASIESCLNFPINYKNHCYGIVNYLNTQKNVVCKQISIQNKAIKLVFCRDNQMENMFVLFIAQSISPKNLFVE